MPKVSFRMASAYRERVFGVQTNTARKIHRSDHTEGRLTTAPSVGVARCPVTERLVGSDAVVDVAEAGGLHRKRSAVIDGCAVEVLVFEGAEETLDDAVSLR